MKHVLDNTRQYIVPPPKGVVTTFVDFELGKETITVCIRKNVDGTYCLDLDSTRALSICTESSTKLFIKPL